MQQHWRKGALLRDLEENHLALIIADSQRKKVTLSVRGPFPSNFFSLLKDGLEYSLKKYKGLDIKRRIPCPGHDGESCSHQFEYHHITGALEREEVITEVQCPVGYKEVSTLGLLFGLHFNTHPDVIKRIDELEHSLTESQSEEFNNLRELVQRGFLDNYRFEQSKIDSQCPNVFILRPRDRNSLVKGVLGERIYLQLLCQAPGEWHPALSGGIYSIDEPTQWLRKITPHLNDLVKTLKYVSPIVGPLLGTVDPNYYSDIRHDIATMTSLVQMIPEIELTNELKYADGIDRSKNPQEARRATMRTIHELLLSVDPARNWGGLSRIVTKENHIHWLCEHHAEQLGV
jgi:hypothetical protein